jgi:NAD(P)-dependent dehydrogenase (short-subunit alcohol dehydrogenase family)
MTNPTTLNSKSVFVTGASRGIGAALVNAALDRGATTVYAAARTPQVHPDPRVRPVRLDLTDPESIAAAAQGVESLDVLINNAGISVVDDLTDESAIEAHLAVNLYGPFRVTRALLPQLSSSRGTLVNVLSLAALATVPITPAYAISKAAALSMTQSWRVLLAGDGISVHAALPGPVDTDMIRGWEIPKARPADVAGAILDGVEAGQEEIFPDPMSAGIEQAWDSGVVKLLERGNAAAIAAMGAA